MGVIECWGWGKCAGCIIVVIEWRGRDAGLGGKEKKVEGRRTDLGANKHDLIFHPDDNGWHMSYLVCHPGFPASDQPIHCLLSSTASSYPPWHLYPMILGILPLASLLSDPPNLALSCQV